MISDTMVIYLLATLVAMALGSVGYLYKLRREDMKEILDLHKALAATGNIVARHDEKMVRIDMLITNNIPEIWEKIEKIRDEHAKLRESWAALKAVSPVPAGAVQVSAKKETAGG